ncbi:MAG: addiction module toxin, Txe/YoeB family [Ignavibacteria bacterium]|nr:addiction module toxin, Txe/YoeB family [Ignavibacteria bacterium]
MKRITFEAEAFEQYNEWASSDKKSFNKFLKLIYETVNTPFIGTGKPEPLRYDLQGFWSRHITDEHRLVYKVTDEEIIIISCKYHY